jgi:hypothetical protein
VKVTESDHCGPSRMPLQNECAPKRSWGSMFRAAWGMGLVLTLGILVASVPGFAKEKEKEKEKGATTQAKTPAQDGPETWHTSSIARSQKGTLVVNYWSKGPLFRAETIVTGHRVNSVVNGTRYYIFDSVSGIGVSIERHENAIAEDKTRGRPFGREWQQMVDDGAEMIMDKEAAGPNVDYEIYQLTDEKGRKQLLVTADDLRLPIRLENYIRSAGQSSFIEYSGWQRSLTISDSFFEPPSNIVFEEFSYDEYVKTLGKRMVGPAPVFYSQLLHGSR